jgi:tetratricopeptide (TPR) repeat protein
VGEFALASGDLDATRDYYRALLSIAEPRAAAAPENPAAQYLLARTCEALGDATLEAGDVTTARGLYEQYHHIIQQLVESDPDDLWYLDTLGHATDRLGEVAEVLGDLDTAAKHYRACADINRRLIGSDPDRRHYHDNLFDALGELGDLALARGEADVVEAACRDRLALQEQLVAELPGDARKHLLLASTYEQLAAVATMHGRPDVARDYTAKAVGVNIRAARLPHADVATLSACARILLTCGPPGLRDPVLATELAERAVKRSKGEHLQSLELLALGCHLTDDHARAVETIEQALALLPADVDPQPPNPLRDRLRATLEKYQHARR